MLKKLAYWILRNSVIIELVNDGNRAVVITNLKTIDPFNLTTAQSLGFEIITGLRADDTGRIKEIKVRS